MPKMRARVKMKDVAGDRARRENVPGHILFMIEISAPLENFPLKQAFFKKSLAKCGIS